MGFPVEYKKNNLSKLSDNSIRNMPSSIFMLKQKEDGWDKEMEKRIQKIPECDNMLKTLLNKNSMSNKNFYNDIKKRYDELKSNIEKIYVFNIATSVENKNENEEKPRIKNVFIVIGLLFKDSYNSAKIGA